MSDAQTYTPSIEYLLAIGFEKGKSASKDCFILTIPKIRAKLHYMPTYNSFRLGSSAYFYPRTSVALSAIIESLSPQN